MAHDHEALVQALRGHAEIMTRDKGKFVRFIDVATCTEAADLIEQQAARIAEYRAVLKAIASECVVPVGTDKQMYTRWRKLATTRVDLARQALGDKQ